MVSVEDTKTSLFGFQPPLLILPGFKRRTIPIKIRKEVRFIGEAYKNGEAYTGTATCTTNTLK